MCFMLIFERTSRVNDNYSLEIVVMLLDQAYIDEAVNTNLYNKALLRAALENE